jgi:hypothetical protein
MKWFKYETLYVNGSSLTAGGGLGSNDIKDEYKRLYNLEWENEKDVTYPKYVADYFNLKLVHKALSGSGAPRLVREVYDYIIEVGIEEARKTMFLLEITDPIHRVDLYCNEIDDYIIANVRYDDDNYELSTKISSIQIQHITTKDGRYFDYKFFEGKIENEIKEFLEKYHNPIAYTEKYYGEVAGLLSFLKENDIINEETKEIILKTFEVKPIPTYDHSNNKILEHCKKLKIWFTTQGFIKEGKYPNVTQYSIVSIQTEVRNLEKLYDSIINEINLIKNDIIKSNEKN